MPARRRGATLLAVAAVAGAGLAGIVQGPALAACTPVDAFAHHSVEPAGASGGADLAGAGFGAATATGDFDGDGFADEAVGAPSDRVDGVATGTVTVFPGTAAGPGAGRRLTEADAGAGNEAGDRFGASLAAGDFDGDGLDDLAVGVPGEAVGSDAGAGAIVVYLGSATGLQAGDWIDQKPGGGANEAGDRFGTALAAGDIDGDGLDDLAIGTPGEAPGGGTAHGGGVYVYRGSATGPTTGWFVREEDAGGTTENGDTFGAAVAIGNVTGDSHPDVVVGAPGEAPNSDPAGSGDIYVVAGTASGPGTGFSRTQASSSGSNEAGDGLGTALALGDFDHDGFADIAAGVPGEAPGKAPAGGSVLVLPGASSQVATGYWLNENQAGEVIGTGDRFGAALAAADVDGDGFADLLVGAPAKTYGSVTHAGVAFLFGGRPRDAGTTRSLDQGRRIAQADLGMKNESGDGFATSLAFGDVTGDGRPDALVGSAGEAPVGQPASGTVSEVSGLSTGVSLGAIVGATTDTTTSLWVRGNHAGTFLVQYRPAGGDTWTDAPETAFGSSTVDFTATVALTGLAPRTTYEYRVSVGCLVDHLAAATFRTMPSASATSLRFTYGADTRQPSAPQGSGERQAPFTLFGDAANDDPDLMILGGDQVYADANGTPTSTSYYFPYYRENFGEANYRSFMSKVPTYMMWDDHEIKNNWDSGTTAAPYPAGHAAFMDYQGSHNPAPFRPGVLYYSFRTGPADFFVTDGRSYRSDSAAADNASKTMLGATQLADLEAWLSASTAKFKFVVTADPFADMTCNLSTPSHDSWCGYRTERQKLFDYIAGHGIKGVISVAGDHHWSGAFTGDNTTAKIYEFMPNPLGQALSTPPSSAPDMLWHYDPPQLVYGLFEVNTAVSPATLTVTMKGAGGAVLHTFVVDENGNLTQH